jgi:hypothetical protein
VRVLLTNNGLAMRAGTELYVRDVALGLLERGHQPVVYSTVLGDVAEELRRATVPVVDHLGKLAVAPDLIHGQHHLETVTALLHFPSVPAVYVCHGWLPWVEAPPRLPRILRWVAVDDTVHDRLVLESGIPPERVEVLLNFVDLARFKPRGPLPSRPARALVFSNLPTSAATCRRCARPAGPPTSRSTRSASAPAGTRRGPRSTSGPTTSSSPRGAPRSRRSPWAAPSCSAIAPAPARS